MPPSEEDDDAGGSGTPPKDKKDSSIGSSRRYHSRGGYQKPTVPRQSKFEGKCKELKGRVYDCSDARQSDLFTRTTKEVAEYVGRTYKYSGNIRLVVKNMALPTLLAPVDPLEGASQTEERIWEKNVDEFVRQGNYLSENVKTLYSLIWGQCTDIMRQKLEALEDFDRMLAEGDGLAILLAIRDMLSNFQSQKYVPHLLHESKRRFYMCSQGRHTTTQAYLEQFKNMVDVIENSGGSLGPEPGIKQAIAAETGTDIGNMIAEQREDLHQQAKSRYLAVAFILGSGRSRFGRLIENLENDYLQGRCNYPTTVTSAYNLLTNCKEDPQNLTQAIGPINNGVSFTNVEGNDTKDNDAALVNRGQQKGMGKGKKEKNKSHITCHHCGKQGHYINECNEEQSAVVPGSTEMTKLMNAMHGRLPCQHPSGSLQPAELRQAANHSPIPSPLELEQPNAGSSCYSHRHHRSPLPPP